MKPKLQDIRDRKELRKQALQLSKYAEVFDCMREYLPSSMEELEKNSKETNKEKKTRDIIR